MVKGKYKSEQITWRCSPSLKQKMEEAAERQSMSLTDWIQRAAEERLEKEALSGSGISEPLSIYISAKDIAWLKQALQLPEIKSIIREITDDDM